MTSHPEIILCQTNSWLEKIKNSRAKTYRFSNTSFSIDDNNIIYQIALQILGGGKGINFHNGK
jgi:phenolic acid decarboxylase